MTTARELLNNVQRQLNDPHGEFWPLTELLVYLNGGIQRLVDYVPAEFTSVTAMSVSDGPKQSLPPQAVSLVTVLANINNDGSYGKAPFRTTRLALALGNSKWLTETGAPTVEWAPDDSDPTVFWVSPPAVAGNKLQVEYIERPSTLRINSKVPVRKSLEEPLADYVLYRAYSKDTDYAGESGLASLHFQAFRQATGAQ